MSFKNKFKKIIKEDLEIDQDLEREAMESSLDDGIEGEDFDLDMDISNDDPSNEINDALSRQTQQMISTLDGWISKIDEFLQFLNSDDQTSVQSTLASAVPDTVFDEMKKSQQSKISRVASDLAALNQTLIGYKSQASNVKFKGV